MYHSISDEPGPTSIPPATFLAQLDVLEACGFCAISLSQFAAWRRGEMELPRPAVVITFDDGFANFACQAFPKLNALKWTATIFLPSGKIGGKEDWRGANTPARALLNWEQVQELAKEGMEFGGHSVTHADLTTLCAQDLQTEVRSSQEQIGERLGQAPISFAPPYGHANQTVRAEIAKYYQISVGTRLQRADRRCDLFEVPRIEMHYFRDPALWRAYLEGRADWFFNTRRGLRGIKQFLPQFGRH